MTALMDTSASMYNPAMSDAPDVPEELAINEVRNRLADVIEKSRYFNGVTYLTNRGKRVAAIVPVPVAEAYQEEWETSDGPEAAAEQRRIAREQAG